MIRKSAVAVTAVAALALGTASATSLGSFDDVTFAASSVDLLGCELDADAISFEPVVPTVDTLLTDSSLATATALVGSLDIDLTSLPSVCIDQEVLDVVILGATDVIAVVEDVDPDSAVSGLLAIDVSSLGLDAAEVQDVRLVLHEG